MRTLWLLTICCICLTLLPACASRKRAAEQRAAASEQRAAAAAAGLKQAAAPRQTGGLHESIRGWGQNQAEAEADALRRATSFLADVLSEVNGHRAMTPSPDYVNVHFIHGEPQPSPEDDNVIERGADKIKMECWRIVLAVTPDDYAAWVRLERQARVQAEGSSRLILSAKILAGVLALLLGVMGLLRLKGSRFASLDVPPRHDYQDCNKAALTKKLVAAGVVLALIGLSFLIYVRSSSAPQTVVAVWPSVYGRLIIILALLLGVVGFLWLKGSRFSPLDVPLRQDSKKAAKTKMLVVAGISLGVLMVLFLLK